MLSATQVVTTLQQFLIRPSIFSKISSQLTLFWLSKNMSFLAQNSILLQCIVTNISCLCYTYICGHVGVWLADNFLFYNLLSCFLYDCDLFTLLIRISHGVFATWLPTSYMSSARPQDQNLRGTCSIYGFYFSNFLYRISQSIICAFWY